MVELPIESSPKTGAGSTKEALIRVLHVDDEAGFVKATKQILEMQGSFQVETALSVKEALKKIGHKAYDVIVSDYQMPERNGLDFLKGLRDGGNDVPFILFTGKGREEVAIEALSFGADSYINKIGKPKSVYGELVYSLRKAVKAKRAEKMLRESEEKYRNLVENSQDAIAIVDFKGNVLFANNAAERLTGYTLKEGKGMNIRKITPKRLWPKSIAMLLKARMGKPIPYFEYELTRKDGTTIPVETGGQAIFKDGKPVAVQIITRDITERKKAEEILKKSEEQYRNIVELSPDGIITMNQKGTVTSINKAFGDLTGFSEAEIVGKHFTNLGTLRARDLPKYMKLFASFLRGKLPSTYEFVYLRKDRTRRWGEAHFSFIKKEEKNVGIQAVLRDITERKRIAEQLKESEEKHRELINGMNDTAWVIDIDTGNFIEVNDAAVEVLGYSREELLSMGPPDIDNSLDAETIRGLIKGMPKDEIQVFETTHTTKDGKPIPVEISSSLVTYQGKQAILSIARDITERKQAEEEVEKIVNDLSMVIEKLGIIGKATRHDARNKLSVIANNVYLAKQLLADNGKASEYLGDIESAIGQIEEIFNFARTYEMVGVEERSCVDVEKSVDEAIILLSGLGDTKLVNECHGLTVQADSQLRQLFYNLIDNSLKHGKNVSQIRVYYEVRNDQLKLVYEDDGVGIPTDEKEKIFKEGYGKGTGYGLYLIRKICEAYGWTIQETGKPGKGAQFTMTIPKLTKNRKLTYQIDKE